MSEDQQAPRPTATLVGRSFVKLYYTHLSEDPNNLHRFYKDESVLSHGVEGQESEIEEVYGQKNIHQKILSMDYKKSKASLSLVDCQLSLNGGVVVSVVGQLFNESQSPVVARRFLQVFFLAVQPSSNTSGGVGYFVLNDIFRFLKEPTVVAAPVSTPTTTTTVNTTPVAIPLPAPATTAAIIAESTHQAPVPVKAHAHDHKQNQHQHHGSHHGQSHSNEKRTEPQVTTATQPNNVAAASSPPVVVLSPQQQQQAPPQAASGKKQNLPPVTIELINPEELTPKTWAHLVGGPAYMEHIRTKVETTKTVQLPNNNDDDETMSDLKLYVSNIPYLSTRQTLEAEFKKYGPIRYINWKNNRGYAFVEYDTEEGVNAVIKHIEKDPIVLEGRTLRIERKKTTRLNQNNGKGINRQGFKRNERRSQSFGGQVSQQRYNSPNNANNANNNANNNSPNNTNANNTNANNTNANNANANNANANNTNANNTSANNITHNQQASNNTKENKDGQNSKQQRPKGNNSQIKPQNKAGAVNKRTVSLVN